MVCVVFSDQSRSRHRHDSVDTDQLSCPATPYVAQSPGTASMSSAVSPPSAVDDDINNIDFNNIGLSFSDFPDFCQVNVPPARQTAQVRPQVRRTVTTNTTTTGMCRQS